MIRLFFVGLILFSQNAFAQLSLLKDISHIYDARTSGLNPQHITNVNGTLFFSGLSDTGVELWKSNGTLSGTTLVKDIFKGTKSSNPTNLVDLKGTLYFLATDEIHGTQIWKSDGSEEGTFMVVDLNHEENYDAMLISTLMAVGDNLYFLMFNDYWQDLWKSDGTPEGTYRIRERVTDTKDGFTMTELNGTAYFGSHDTNLGHELWKTDGTLAGTALVKDIVPGAGISFVASFKVFQNALFFTCRTDAGLELWKSDGTTDATLKVKNIQSAPGNAYSVDLQILNNQLVFLSNEGTTQGLWKSDGTSDGTVKLFDTPNFDYSVVATTSMLFFTKRTIVGFHYETDLWKTDGTEIGTVLVKHFVSPFYYVEGDRFAVPMNDAVYFTAASGSEESNDIQLWKSDGTTLGTEMITNILFYDESAGIRFNPVYPSMLTAMSNTLYFTTNNARQGNELWKTDGTLAGTTMITNEPEANTGSQPSGFTKLNDLIIFSAGDEVGGLEAWRTDKTEEGTFMLKDIYPGAPPLYSSQPDQFTNYKDHVYFTAYESNAGRELWRTDGTPAGTQLFKDFNLAGSSGLNSLSIYNDILFFAANGRELWKTDGTLEGTQLVKSFATNILSTLYVFKNDLYFIVGKNLWKSDGTTSNTLEVKQLTDAEFTLYPKMINTDDQLFISIATYPEELWVSDGTEEGTSLIKKVNSLHIEDAAVLEGKIYFVVTTDNFGTSSLWKSNGTESGTGPVTDLALTNTKSGAVNNFVFFTAYDDEHGIELWKTDDAGTTTLVKDIWEGKYSSDPNSFLLKDDELYFTAYDGKNRAIWKTNGETGSTIKVNEDATIDVDAYRSLTLIDETLFVVGYEPATGEEIYLFKFEDDTPVTATDESLSNAEVKVYPNPAIQNLRVETPTIEGQKEIRVLNIAGVELLSERYSSRNFDVDVSAFPAGLYFLRVISSKGVSTIKFIKKKE